MMAVVRYADSQQGLPISLIATWNRGDIAAPVMSASSGPKEYLKNDVWLLFDTHKQVNRVILVRSAGALFFLMRDGANCWFDVKGKQVNGLGA
jgi:hypothetical protein